MLSRPHWTAGPRRGGEPSRSPARHVQATQGQEANPSGATHGWDSTRAHELGAEQALLLEVIASLAHALGLYDVGGQEQWTRIPHTVGGGARNAALGAAMQDLARAATVASPAGSRRDAARGQGSAVVREVELVDGCYRLRAVPLQPAFFGTEASVLVIAEHLRGESPDWQRFGDQFGLTAREVEVALLLAERRTNAEIARVLGISAHTARHHTERVLFKLGAKKRHEVAPILRAATAADG